MSKRDQNVYQHLLRSLRRTTAHALGATVKDTEPNGAEILRAAVTQAVLELDAVVELLQAREHADKGSDRALLSETVSALRWRLDVALELGEGLFDPDRPYQSASALEYHPEGFDAGLKASHAERAAEGSVTP